MTARTPDRREPLHLAQQPLDVEARHARQLLVRERLGRDEERHDELVEREPRLAHEPAQRSRAAEAPQPGDRERAHAGMVRRRALRQQARAVSRAPAVLARRLDADLGERRVGRPLLQLDPLGEELPRGAPGREQRQRDEDPGEPVDLAAGEQAEDHEQRMEAQRAPHHLRHDDVALELLDAEEEQRDPERRERVPGRARTAPAGPRRATARCTG